MAKKRSAGYDLAAEHLDDIDPDDDYSEYEFELEYESTDSNSPSFNDSTSIAAGLAARPSRTKVSTRSRRRPQMWDDDWQDPADDLMSDFEDE